MSHKARSLMSVFPLWGLLLLGAGPAGAEELLAPRPEIPAEERAQATQIPDPPTGQEVDRRGGEDPRSGVRERERGQGRGDRQELRRELRERLSRLRERPERAERQAERRERRQERLSERRERRMERQHEQRLVGGR